MKCVRAGVLIFAIILVVLGIVLILEGIFDKTLTQHRAFVAIALGAYFIANAIIACYFEATNHPKRKLRNP